MGVRCSLATLSDRNIERLLADPPLVWRVVVPERRESFEREWRAQLPWPARLLGWRRPSPPPDLELAPGERTVLDLDKTWRVLHLALTGVDAGGDPPLGFINGDGGREIGTDLWGYGPARAFTSDEARSILEALEHLDEATIRGRIEPAALVAQGLEPSEWWTGDGVELVGALRRFLSEAVRQRFGFLIWF